MRENFKKIVMAMEFGKKKQQSFLEDLASLINDGVSLKEAIHIIETINSGKIQQIAANINDALARGQHLADGLHGYFPPSIIEIIRAGENSGKLNSALQSAAQALNQQTTLWSHLANHLTYPLIVLILALVMLVVIKRTVLENFAHIKPLLQWPTQGITLYHLAQWVEHGWWLLILFLALIIFVTYKFLTSYTSDFRSQLDALPILGFYRETMAARFLQSLGLLVSNGIIVKRALNILAEDAQPYLAWHIMMMEYRLSGGIDNIAEVLDTNLLRKADLLRLKIIAQGKGFGPALISLGHQAMKRNQQFAMMSGRLAGALLLILSAAIAANIILGIYSVGSVLAQ